MSIGRIFPERVQERRFDRIVAERVIESPERCIAWDFVCGEAQTVFVRYRVWIQLSNSKLETVGKWVGWSSHVENDRQTCFVFPPCRRVEFDMCSVRQSYTDMSEVGAVAGNFLARASDIIMVSTYL